VFFAKNLIDFCITIPIGICFFAAASRISLFLGARIMDENAIGGTDSETPSEIATDFSNIPSTVERVHLHLKKPRPGR